MGRIKVVLMAACTGRTKLKPNHHPPALCPLAWLSSIWKVSALVSLCKGFLGWIQKFLIFPGQLDKFTSGPSPLPRKIPPPPCSMANSCDLQGEHQVWTEGMALRNRRRKCCQDNGQIKDTRFSLGLGQNPNCNISVGAGNA